jgi:hypothetical protein
MAEATSSQAGTTVDYTQPGYYTQTGQNLAGGVNDLLGQNGYINDTMNNWYNASPGQGALGQYATWNANQQQQFMNPYVQNVVNEQARLSNQNLFENVIPQVNSTFTGAGQFGSSRNADFMNRAIRDQQYNLQGQQGQTLFNAQQAAGNQYKDWTQMGTQASQQDFTNWLQQANYPLSALSQVGQIFGNMRTTNPQSVSTSSAGPTGMEKLTGALGILNSGLNDGTINKLLEWSGLNFQ